MNPRKLSSALGALAFIAGGVAAAQAPPPTAPEPTASPPPTAAEPAVSPEPAPPPPTPTVLEPPAEPSSPAVAPSTTPTPVTSPIASAVSPASPLTQRLGDASVTLYGDIDLYLNLMHSNSGKNIFALQDGAILRSRLGVKGGIDFGDGFKGNFTLEQGINATSGAPADPTRLFDRQAWAGLVTPAGEFRVGRQNTEVFLRGGAIDYGERTLGAVINAFGVPSRYDSDLVYISPRWSGLQLVGHYSLQGSAVDSPTQQ